ncbi:MAG: aspartate/glutamate racemase family protein [Spirochaetaceae bacterium]|nr:MAG: aspartate/glutamate racemase family protein [Spirochaetaceae bacterium]
MGTIGLIGGMSWESTLEYYRLINQGVGSRLGGLHSARCLLYSVDFAEIERLQTAGDWDATATILADAAVRLERGGADFIVLCTNTMHIVADAITAAVSVPLLHIADATANAIRAAGVGTVGLLGTRFTMEQEFYLGRLRATHGLTVVIPEESDRELVHSVIYGELCRGEIRSQSRTAYVAVIDRLAASGAEAIILGCTEIGLLIRPADSPLPIFDTTRIHAEAAVERALSR